MQFAMVNNARRTAEPKLKGACPVCARPMLPKCGDRVLWHWSHQGKRHCDVWWENETPWHRAWKARFPEVNREVVQFDQQSGERHVADVKTDAGVVLESQNSPMSIAELRARERFYGRMLWILNGESFHCSIGESVPEPHCEFVQDIVCFPKGHIFWRKSENAEVAAGRVDLLVEVHSRREIKNEIDQNYAGHHLFEWLRPRTVWFEATAPVYFDFGDDMVYHLQQYQRLWCVQCVTKASLVEAHGGAYLRHSAPISSEVDAALSAEKQSSVPCAEPHPAEGTKKEHDLHEGDLF